LKVRADRPNGRIVLRALIEELANIPDLPRDRAGDENGDTEKECASHGARLKPV
jgi:hypothetical protein